MTAACQRFRQVLERRLMGQPDPPRVSELDWHEHVHGCCDCRALLHSEEALEVLLASLPELRLPEDLARRVLARLREGADARLDELLAFDAEEPLVAPEGLAARVLARLAPERAAREDRVLEDLLDRAGDVVVPEGIGDRVLAGLAAHRHGRSVGAGGGGVPFRVLRAPALGLAAAVLVASLLLVAFWRLRAGRVEDGAAGEGGSNAVATSGDAIPDGELLAALDVLEHWDLLADVRDPDLAAYGRFDAGDEALLEFFGAELLADEATSDGSGGR